MFTTANTNMEAKPVYIGIFHKQAIVASYKLKMPQDIEDPNFNMWMDMCVEAALFFQRTYANFHATEFMSLLNPR